VSRVVPVKGYEINDADWAIGGGVVVRGLSGRAFESWKPNVRGARRGTRG